MKKLILLLSLLAISSCSMSSPENEQYPHGKPLNEYPWHKFEVIANIKNKVTKEEKKFDYFTHITLVESGAEIDVVKNFDEYKNEVWIWLSEYVTMQEIDAENPFDNWIITIDKMTEIYVSEDQLDDLRRASDLYDYKNLCWENMSGALIPNDKATTPNEINGFSETSWTIFDKYQYYVPKECTKKI